MDLFQMSLEKQLEKSAPLADRMRPEKLEDYYGQRHLLDKGMPLYRLIVSDRVGSMIFYGPPGTGKTTLAMIISKTTNRLFEKISAVTSGIKELRKVVKEAEDNLSMYNKKTIVFIDEIHRFNKAQQDALLPYVEQGIITLIGATTENPYFEVNKALVSRCQIIELKELDKDAIVEMLLRALKDKKNGLGNKDINIDKNTLEILANISGGDGRSALNSLEVAILSTEPDEDGSITIDEEAIRNSVTRSLARYDKNSDEHYDTISAFIKSMRGSDVDAAIYYLAKMINAGEDPKFIARRMIIFASEDIGNADPRALSIATDVFKAIEIIGMPEGRIILSQGVIYLATAPKSNSSYIAIDKALDDVKKGGVHEIPSYLRDAHFSNAKDLNRGIGYKYPHDYPRAYVSQQYIPDAFKETIYYKPSNRGYENNIRKYINYINKEEEKEQ